MIKKLRIKMITAFMLSFLAVLVIIISTINILNYQSVVKKADDVVSLLAVNDGKFPVKFDKPMTPKGPDRFDDMSPELPYESRFFSVLLSNAGEIIATDTAQIAAVNQTSAAEFAKQVLASGKERGFVSNYRYFVSRQENFVRIIFLDTARNMETFKTFLFGSIGISLVGFLAVFILVLMFSGRIIKPVSESYEKQKRFITDAGHEIKTPVTIIDADAEVLEMDLGENEWLQDIRKQTKRLGTLTNDLIYLSRMDEEQMQLQTIDFPLSDIVTETAQSFQALAKAQGKEFEVRVEPMLSLNGDEKAIRQLVSILLDNALKYSNENGYISINLRKQGKTFCLEVYNTSDNIAKEDVPNIFDRFYRADGSRNSRLGGYGIGLSIAKAVVSAHKGKISAHSDGKSLKIMVILPA